MFFKEDNTLEKLDTFQKENEMFDKMKDSKNKRRLQAIQKQHSTEKAFITKPKIQKIESRQPTNIEPKKNKLSDEELIRKIAERKRNTYYKKTNRTINNQKNTKNYFMYSIPIIIFCWYG